MKKIIFSFILGLTLICLTNNAAALDLILSIPDANVDRIVAAVITKSPNNECAVWDLETVTCVTKKYTDLEWVNEVAFNWFVDTIERGEQMILDKALAEKRASIIKSEELKIIVPSRDNYGITIR